VISANDLKRGDWIELDGDPWLVLDVSRQTPSARGASLLVKAKVRNAKTGGVQDQSFKGADKLGSPNVEQRPVQYLYADATAHHFMDQETYDQFGLTRDELGEALSYLVADMELKALMLDGRVLGVELPAHVDLLVTECPPPVKGGASGNMTKTATLETGLEVQVPPYLEQGQRVRVDTRDGRFVQRIKD